MRVIDSTYYFEYPEDTKAAFVERDPFDFGGGFDPNEDPKVGITEVYFVYGLFLKEYGYTIPIKPINSKNIAYKTPRKVQKPIYNYQRGVYVRAYESRCLILDSTPAQDKELYDLVTGKTKLPSEVEEELRKI